MVRHVVLIGLPGAGKTSVGRRLARALRRPFADADELLELTIGSTLPRLFRERGEDEVRRLESQTLLELLSRCTPLVVSAPGGVRIEAESRATLAAASTVFWMRGSVRFLVDLGDPTYRPRLGDGHEAALTRLAGELSDQYAEIADHIVDVEPFHSLDVEPSHAIAHHIADIVGVGDPPDEHPVPQPEAQYAEIADHIVDVEPFRSIEGDPTRAIVRRILDLLDP
jgi:shikimate kinase